MTSNGDFWYASIDDIQYVYGLTRNAIYIHASRDHWRRIRRNRRTLYHWEDIADTLVPLDKNGHP
jgi:hypothetical protein